MKKIYHHALTITFLVVSTITSSAAVVNWDGDTSATWATPGNWDTAPLTTDIARFNLPTYGGNPVFAPNAGTTSIGGIQIGSGNGAMTLTTSNLSIGAGGITVESGAGATTIGRVTAVTGADQTWTNNSTNLLSVTAANVIDSQVTLAGTGNIAFNTINTGAGGVKIDGANVTINASNQFGTGAIILNAGSLSTLSRTLNNAVSFTGDFTFAPNSTAANGLNSVAVKTTTGNRIITIQTLSTYNNNGSFSITNGALQLGGNLEIRSILGGDNGLRTNTFNLTAGIDLNGANRTLTLSQAVGVTNIGLLLLNADLTINGAGSTATALNGGFDTGGVARMITFDNAGTGIPTLSGALTGTASTVTIAGSSTNARIGALTGTAHAINVNSTTGGSFLFNGASTYSGGTTITNGIATASVAGVAATSGPLGTGALIINGGRLDSTIASALLGSSAITVNGGELRTTVVNGFVTNSIPITLNGGTLRGLTAVSSTNFGGGVINVTGNSTIVNERSGAAGSGNVGQTFGTSVAVGNAQLNVTSTDNQTGGISTVTLGAGTLTGNAILNVTNNPSNTNSTVLALTSLGVTGSGNQIAAGNGTVTVSGATTVGTGTLLVNGNLTATGGVTVTTGGTLGGSGFITGDATVNGTLSAGNSPGLLTFSGGTSDLILASSANSLFEINGTGRGTTYDAVNVGGALTMGGTLTLDFGFTPQVTDTFDLFNFNSQSGAFSSIVFVDAGFAGSYDPGTGVLSLSAIPEPSTYALLIGGLGMLAFLRRRSKS